MKSLIIGAAGFVGTYLIRHLCQDLGHEVAVTKMPREQIQIGEKYAEQISVYDLNILEPEAVFQILLAVRPNYIFHLAAQSSVTVAWKHPDLTVDVNIRGAVNVLEALRRLDDCPKIVLVGSGEEYGEILPEEIPVCEDHPLDPGNIYAATKACQNMIGKIYAKAYGMQVIMVRAFNHIGPNQQPLFVAADFCRQAAQIEAGRAEALIRVGNLHIKRDFTDVRDVVRAYAMLAADGKAGQTYNVGSGRAVSIEELLQIILEKTSVCIRVETDPSKMRPIDAPVIEADIRKLREATGWEPKIRLEQTIEDTLNYWRNKIRCT